MDDPSTVTLIAVAFFGLLTAGIPLAMQWQKSKSDAVIRAEDRAARAEVAELAAEAVEEIKKKAAMDTVALRDINEKQDVIHLLVNSNLTAALQAEHDAMAHSLVVMLELQDMKKAAGREPTSDAIGAIEVMRGKLADLRRKLDERALQAKLVESEQLKQLQATASEKVKAVTADVGPAVPVKVVETKGNPIKVKETPNE